MCNKHNIKLQEVCGEEVCGLCYMDEELMAWKFKLHRSEPVDLTYGLSGHDPHFRMPVVNDSPVV